MDRDPKTPRTIEGLTTLEEFLSEEGVLEEVTPRAEKRVQEQSE